MKIYFILVFMALVGLFVITSCDDDQEPYPTYWVDPFNVEGKDTIKLESGLQYIVSHKGSGKKSYDGAKVKFDYSGYIQSSGAMFNTTVSFGGDPVELTLDKENMLDGLYEALMLMQEGDKIRFLVPYYLAYGADYGPSSYRATITPYSDLAYDIELLDVN